MGKIKTNDLRKGDWVRLTNGWVAQIADNRRGNIRVAKVYGLFTEAGSVYSHDIYAKIEVDDPESDNPRPVRTVALIEYTEEQKELRKRVGAF